MRLAITYDISDNRTRNRVFKILESYGAWKQYSVFELEISDIQRLQMDGVITGRVALVDQEKIGLGLSVFVFIEAGEQTKEWQASFAATLRGMPEVVEVYRLAGD